MTDLEKAEAIMATWRNLHGNKRDNFDMVDLTDLLIALESWAKSSGIRLKWEAK